MSNGFAEAAAQIHAQTADFKQAEAIRGASPADLGQQVAAGVGAAPPGTTGVDVAELLAFVQQLQARVEAVEAERAAEKTAGLPDVVVRAEQILADLQHRHGALSAASPLQGAVDRAGALLDAAKAAVDSGDSTELLSLAGALEKHLARVAGPAASADISYARQLVGEDLVDAAANLRKPSNVVAGSVVSRSDAPVPRKLGPVVHTFS
jgi:hypothetical protein